MEEFFFARKKTSLLSAIFASFRRCGKKSFSLRLHGPVRGLHCCMKYRARFRNFLQQSSPHRASVRRDFFPSKSPLDEMKSYVQKLRHTYMCTKFRVKRTRQSAKIINKIESCISAEEVVMEEEARRAKQRGSRERRGKLYLKS
jgi:hypothetical protein